MHTKKYLIISGLILIIFSAFYLPKKAEKIAIRYMEINKIYNDESYKEVKSRIYDISSDYVKDTFFSYDNYPLTDRNPITYEIHSVSSDFLDFKKYIVYIDYTANGYLRLTSTFEIVDGIVEDSYRVDE